MKTVVEMNAFDRMKCFSISSYKTYIVNLFVVVVVGAAWKYFLNNQVEKKNKKKKKKKK